MKKITLYTAVALLCVIAIASACRKGLTCDPKNGNTDFKQCVITAARYFGGGFDSVHFVFAYNGRHDPVNATPDFIGTGSPQRVFYYDSIGRLVSYAGIYTNGAFETWHNYQYDAAGRIVGDSTYVFGQIGDLGPVRDRRFSSFLYDSENRIIQETMMPSPFGGPAPFVKTYTYDASGNLAGVAHDNKPNFLLTNKVWRFITRNYSVNNLSSATAYNDHLLPTSFSGDTQLLFDNLNLFPQLELTYDCGGDYSIDK